MIVTGPTTDHGAAGAATRQGSSGAAWVPEVRRSRACTDVTDPVWSGGAERRRSPQKRAGHGEECVPGGDRVGDRPHPYVEEVLVRPGNARIEAVVLLHRERLEADGLLEWMEHSIADGSASSSP